MEPTQYLLRAARDADLRAELEESLGNYSHQFRNRLNSLKLGLYLARRQSTGELGRIWDSLERGYQALEDRLDLVQKVCRDVDLDRIEIDLNLIFADRQAAWAEILGGVEAQLSLHPPEGRCPTRVDVDRIGFALDELVRWRASAREDRREVRVEWMNDGVSTTIHWSEPGPGGRPAAGPLGDPRQVWTLPLLTRVVGDHGGALTLEETRAWDLTLCWTG